jgi:hypothetical protein
MKLNTAFITIIVEKNYFISQNYTVLKFYPCREIYKLYFFITFICCLIKNYYKKYYYRYFLILRNNNDKTFTSPLNVIEK